MLYQTGVITVVCLVCGGAGLGIAYNLFGSEVFSIPTVPWILKQDVPTSDPGRTWLEGIYPQTSFPGRRWVEGLFGSESTEGSQNAQPSIISRWTASLLSYSTVEMARDKWVSGWLSGQGWSDLTMRCSQVVQGTLEPVILISQNVKHTLDRVPVTNSLLMLLSSIPYVLVFVIKLWPATDSHNPRSHSVSMGTTRETTKSSISVAQAKEIIARFQSLQQINSIVEKDISQKAAELSLMAKMVEFLREKCRQQAKQLLKKGTELEEMARTVEYLQRPSSKRWSDLLDRVYKNSYPAVIKIEYYQLQVPLDGGERGDNPAGKELVEKDDSATEVNSGTELDWDESG